MSMSVATDFDPYHAWLLIQERQRPLNPYQLLGLKNLEADFQRIRAAAMRQRSLLEAQQQTEPELWQRVNDELEDAISTLLDSEREQMLDAALKRAQSSRAAHSAVPPAHIGSGPIRCRGCQKENSPQRRFCCGCGVSLFDQCPQCSTEVVASERFCGHCGANLQETRGRQESDLEHRVQQARSLQAEHKFAEAVALLRSVAMVEDARYDNMARQALALLDEFANERKLLEERVQLRIQKARELLSACAFEKASEKLAGIPEALRTDEARELLGQVRAKQEELLKLSAEIREAIAQKQIFGVLPKIEQLLALKPDHAQAKELAGQIRDQICLAARKKTAECSYDEARMLMESIPEFIRNEDVEQLLDRVQEADSLATDIRLSPLADDVLVALAQRFAKIATKDPAAAKQLADIQKRRIEPPADRHLLYPAWSAAPRRPLLGVQVDLLGHLTRCDFASPALEAKLREQPGQYLVALGLGLQARDQAAVAINLLPEEKKPNFFGMSISLRKPALRGGWGLDLSPTGLRAIRLSPESTGGRVKIDAVVHVPHSKPLGQPGEEVFDCDLIAATLRTFTEQHPLAKEKEKRETVAVAISGARTLGRFFDLPPVSAKKLPELVQFEAKHQVPFPLSELNWGYAVVDEAEKDADQAPRRVVLVATKELHATERLRSFQAAGIPVDVLTAEPLALHNAVVHEFFAESPANLQLAFMDIGAQGSNFVVSSRRGVWFRHCASGGDEFTSALVKQLQLTHTSAEETKRAPHKARRFYQVQEAFQPLLVKFGSEVERSLASLSKQFPDRLVDRLYLAGGGAATHGLLRYLVHGK
jgi:type IV pilus assembly protein PilM